jgi:DNA-binding HxlR family transcriptional regulator
MAETPDSATETADSSPPDHDCLCPLGGVMDLLSRRYAMQLVCVVDAIGPARYGDIEATFEEVSSSTLSTRLEELVDADILSREQYDEIPPRVEYELTETGEELGQRLEPLLRWAEEIDETELATDQE